MARTLIFILAVLLCGVGPLSTANAQRPEAPARGNSASDEKQPADQVFSGPQIGETLPDIPLRWFAEGKMSEPTVLKVADSTAPMVAILATQRTRPGFALIRMLTTFQEKQAADKLQTSVIFLTPDPADIEKWLGQTNQYFPNGSRRAIAEGGVEGPGELGINRDVELTIIIAKEGKVVANYALVQPSLNADGPKILESIIKAMGGDKVPTIEEVMGAQGQAGQRMRSR